MRYDAPDGAAIPGIEEVLKKQVAQSIAQSQLAQSMKGIGEAQVQFPEIALQGYSGPSAQQMAQSEYAPQFAALQSIIDSLGSRYQTSQRDIGGMYEALANATAAKSPEIAGRYTESGNKIGTAYNEAIQSTQSAHNDSLNRTAELLGRLGIQQAAPSALGSQGEALTKAVGDLGSRRANYLSYNTGQKDNEVSYNDRTSNTQRLAGKNALTDLAKQFQQLNSQYDLQKLGLVSGQQSAQNKYGMQISEMEQEAQKSNMDQMWKRLQYGLDREGLDLRRGSAELDLQKWQDSMQSDTDKAAIDRERLNLSRQDQQDAYDNLAQKAAGLTGNAGEASAYTQKVVNSYADYSRIAQGNFTLGGFLDVLMEQHRPASDYERSVLQSLGTAFYQKAVSGNRNVN